MHRTRSRCCSQSPRILHETHAQAHNGERWTEKNKYTRTQEREEKNLIMQIIFPISLFHMNRSLFHNPVKRASHRSLSVRIREHPIE